MNGTKHNSVCSTQQVTGMVTKCEMRKFDHPDPYIGRYSTSTEYYQLKLMIALRTDDGEDIWFYSPGVTFFVSCPVGCPIAAHGITDSNDWIKDGEIETNLDGKTSGSYGIPQVEVGDHLTIKGRVKRDTRFGKQFNYVKLMSRRRS